MREQQVISVKLSEVNISINGINITFHINYLRLYNGTILNPHNVERQNFEPRAKTLPNLVTVIFINL